MPELPEVEVVRAGLARHITGATIDAVEVLHPRPVRRHLAGPQAFADELQGLRFATPRRRGKYLWLPLDSGDAILAHLGMSGQLVLQPSTAPDERHLRVRFQISGGEPGRELRFVDQRMFGGLHLSLDGAELPAEIAHIALDPLETGFEAGAVVRKMRKRRSAIKRQLLDQSLISGVGNIYADEALWRAKLHGERQGDRIPAKQLHELLVHVREVMTDALAQGGTSFDALYVNVNGESGYFSRSLDAYGREGEPCFRCGTPIVRAAFMNRSSHFCPVCQRKC